MGNYPSSSGERRQKTSDSYPIPVGQAFHIDKNRVQKITPQHSEDDSTPLYCKPIKPGVECPEVPGATRPLLITTNAELLPCVIRWSGGGKDVAVAGGFNNWKPLPMVKSEKDFVHIVDLPEGNHEYKFLVDGEWRLSASEPAEANALGTENNVLSVKESDFRELEDSLMKDPNDPNDKATISSPFVTDVGPTPAVKKIVSEVDSYGQEVPEAISGEKKKGPPLLPPHLLQVILNKDTPVSCEPTLLPEPNHVMLNHMYALSIRDGMMVLSTSHRFRKKCVTTLIYRPI